MSTTGSAGASLDLEKELSCAVCTDILYQPLTLLDCLHTFCGSCLREWFSWQATAASESRNAHPYTCPSCRAAVRAARPNANVTTLLEMYLQANPGKGKTEVEKEESREQYVPGDDVLPPVHLAERSDGDSEDERLVEQVREMSVADIDPAVEANRRSRLANRERRARTGNTARDREVRRREGVATARQRQDAVERNVTHQSSLRSLLSADGEDSAEIQQEILTSILSSGMLDGIDLDNLTPAQEEDLTERIANAYRQRHREIHSARRDAERSSGARTHHQSSAASAAHNDETARHRSQPANTRTHLIDQWTQDSSRGAHRPVSTSGQSSREATNMPPTTAGAVRTPPRATIGASDLDHPNSAEHRHRAIADLRSNTDPQQRDSSPRITPTAAPPSPSIPRRATDTHADMQRPTIETQQRSPSNPATSAQSLPYPVDHSVDIASSRETQGYQAPPRQMPVDSASAPEMAITIPSVNCNRCNATEIQHQLHYHCSKCDGGDFDLCRKCYRAGAGCNNWWGFGYSAQARFEQNAPEGGWPASYERPHVLTARQYRPRSEFNRQTDSANSWKPLQEGAFCERCYSIANDCYWHCAICMEGAWGFCNACVHQGKHCTHPLLPTAYEAGSSDRTVQLPNMQPNSMVLISPSTRCDTCHRDVQRQDPYLHCPSCRHGDYDMCTHCHRSLVATGKIGGPAERRQCLQGHGMVLVQFQSTTPGIEQRVVLAEPVVDSATQGTGRCLALWSWFPLDDVNDELSFPKYAEIRNVRALNEDYSVGSYAGDVGLLPSNHVRPI